MQEAWPDRRPNPLVGPDARARRGYPGAPWGQSSGSTLTIEAS